MAPCRLVCEASHVFAQDLLMLEQVYAWLLLMSEQVYAWLLAPGVCFRCWSLSVHHEVAHANIYACSPQVFKHAQQLYTAGFDALPLPNADRERIIQVRFGGRLA